MREDREIRMFEIKRTAGYFSLMGVRTFCAAVLVTIGMYLYRYLLFGKDSFGGAASILLLDAAMLQVMLFSMFLNYSMLLIRLVISFGSTRREALWGPNIMFAVYVILSACLYLILASIHRQARSGVIWFLISAFLTGAMSQLMAYLEMRTGDRKLIFVATLVLGMGIAMVTINGEFVLSLPGGMLRIVALVGAFLVFMLTSIPMRHHIRHMDLRV
ncbi:MAG: hypothetical protein J6P60_05840 [Lachnospiraceae bacterium]|nr:hypothetical protein [Lachnospiraceae bacterium]